MEKRRRRDESVGGQLPPAETVRTLDTHTHTQAHKTSGCLVVQLWKNGDGLAEGSDPLKKIPKVTNAPACLRCLTNDPHLEILRTVYSKLVLCNLYRLISDSNKNFETLSSLFSTCQTFTADQRRETF